MVYKIYYAIKRTIVPILLLFLAWASLYYFQAQDAGLFGWQLFMYKLLLPNTGFLNAHVVRKLAFKEANWKNDEQRYHKLLIIALYVMFIYAYAEGG